MLWKDVWWSNQLIFLQGVTTAPTKGLQPLIIVSEAVGSVGLTMNNVEYQVMLR